MSYNNRAESGLCSATGNDPSNVIRKRLAYVTQRANVEVAGFTHTLATCWSTDTFAIGKTALQFQGSSFSKHSVCMTIGQTNVLSFQHIPKVATAIQY